MIQIRLAQMLLLLSMLIIGIGLWEASRTAVYLVRAETTIGQVIAVRPYLTKDPAKPGTISQIAYVTRSGQEVTFESIYTSGGAGYHVGTEVPVIYDPDNPTDARINELYNLWFLPCFLLTCPGPFLLLLAWIFRYRRLLVTAKMAADVS
jgi:hypothetical protein